jgi:transcriptional regulator with XRE-family HTH domain
MRTISAQVDIATRLGENLTRRRKAAGMSQDALGLAADLHRTEISGIERGLRVPRIDTLVKLAAGLSIPPEDLLDGIGWQPGTIQHGGFSVTPSGGES